MTFGSICYREQIPVQKSTDCGEAVSEEISKHLPHDNVVRSGAVEEDEWLTAPDVIY